MNYEQIIQMAREAGFMFEEEEYLEEFLMDAVWVQDTEITETLERFAALVADAEAKRIHDEGMVTVGHMREQIAAEREAWQQEREQLMTQIGVLRSQILGMRMEFGEGSTVSNLSAALQAEDAVNAAAIRARGQQ